MRSHASIEGRGVDVVPPRGPPEPPGPHDYATLFRLAPTPLLVADATSLVVVAANDAAARSLGRSRTDLDLRPFRDLLSPTDGERLAALVRAPATVEGPLAARSAWEIVRHDSSTVRYEVAPDRFEVGGRPAKILFQTPQAHATPGEVASLQPGLPELSFLALHDLKEPMYLVRGYLRLLSERKAQGLDAEGREFLEYAVQGADRVQALVANFLEFLRMDVKGITWEPLDLAALWAGTVDSFRLPAMETGAAITQDSLPVIAADRFQLGRLLQNLLSNALKFHSDAPARVHLSVASSGDTWEFGLRDNGIGIPEKDIERVLHPFQRVHSADRYPGTGLGLSTSRKIVELHGGRLWLTSRPGEGTVVHFTLPKTREGAR
ncbi:MAG: sensor histidine kinase [Methanobacteriota archaeon]